MHVLKNAGGDDMKEGLDLKESAMETWWIYCSAITFFLQTSDNNI